MPRRKGNWRRTPHEKKETLVCEWCGERFEASRELAKTCSDVCRSRLHVFTRHCGFAPASPPGKVTPKEAIDEIVAELLAREAVRRQANPGQQLTFICPVCHRVQ